MEYLLKSILCLLVLLLIHRVLLQKEVLHRFNRFYLLAAVVFSFLIPLNSIEVPAAKNQVAEEIVTATDTPIAPDLEVEVGNFIELDVANPVQLPEEVPVDLELNESVSKSTFPWEGLIWTVYVLVCGLFLIRFLRNIQILRTKISKNPHVPFRGETLVLHPENQSPFSFLKYIFISKPSFETEGISDAVFAHEQCHVREKHSWDILFIEALLVPFWFHPGLHFVRQAIKLNHEFIADQAALSSTSIKDYQQLLLNLLLAKPTQSLASSLNFSLTKKRMQMMKNKAGSPFKWMKILVMVPLIAGIVYLFSDKVTVQAEEEVSESRNQAPESPVEEIEVNIKILSDREVEVDGESVPIQELAKWLDEIKSSQPLVRFSANPGIKMGTLADIQEILREGEVRRVVYEEQSQKPDTWQEIQEAYYKNAYILVEDKNMVYTHKTYFQLTEQEKKGLFGPMIPRDKENPDPALYEKWKDHKTYAIWIDGLVTTNDKLNNFAATDFVGFFQSGVNANARSKRFPQPFQVHLYTDEYYDKNFGPESPDRQPRIHTDTITLTSRLVTWNKDIQKYPDPNTAYLQKNARYENLRTSGTIYSQKSQQEKAELERLYQELNDEYSKSSDKRKKSLKEPIVPDSDTRRNGDPSQSSSGKIGARTVGNSGENDMVYSLAFSPELQSKALKEYLTLYGQYQTKAYENRIFSQPVEKEVLVQQEVFRNLDKKYQELSFDERRRVKRATFPYAKLEKDGKEVFVKIEDLTPQQRKELGC